MNTANSLGRIGLVLFILLSILPILFSLGYAFAYSIGGVGLMSDGYTAVHWQKLLDQTEIWTSFGLSFYIASITVCLTVLLSLGLVLYLHRPLNYGPLSYIIYFPLALPATVAAFLVFQLFSGSGYLTRILLRVGLIENATQFPGFTQDPYGIGIIIAHVGLAVPFFTLLFMQVYKTEHVSTLSRLSQTLGASRSQSIFRVAIPILLKRSFTNIVLLFIAVLGSYEIPLLLGLQEPQMISVLTMRKYSMFDISEKPEAFIVAILYTLIVLLLITLAFRKGKHNFHQM